MIDDELKQLGEFAESLEKEEPLDLLSTYISQITEEIENISEYQKKLSNEFGDDIIKLVNDYTFKDLITPLISYQLLSVLVSYVKKMLIEKKANSLGIEKRLYKKEMKFLFKGKTK